MNLHTQLHDFVNTYGPKMLTSPYVGAMMDDCQMFREPENRLYKSIFRQMAQNGHIGQIAAQWDVACPSIATYAPAYNGVDATVIRYAVECIGFALGKTDKITETLNTTDPISQTVALEDDVVHYISHGSDNNIGTLIPAPMATAVHSRLNAIADEHDSVVEFVREQLQEPSCDDITSKISGEQIDGVALAITQMLNGRGFILGDMTGIGKGRQLAMLLKWAVRNGHQPVFVTEKDTLFNDLYRDLADIGYSDLRPFILNSDSAARITDLAGNLIYNLPSQVELDDFKANGEIPLGYDFLLMTYSQVNKPANLNWKSAAVMKAIEGSYLLLDESHNASGLDSNVGEFFREAVSKSIGVCFASATYAKYPSSMPLYAIKTAMGHARIPSSELLGIVAHGGPILQEVMAKGLVESGAMIRRQRDMSEVDRRWLELNDDAEIARLRASYDKIIELIDDFRDFYQRFLVPFLDAKDPMTDLCTEHRLPVGFQWKPDECKIRGWNPQLRLAPVIRQLIFAIKTEQAVQTTLGELRAGRKPIVQVARTMASNIARIIQPGNQLPSSDFALILKNSLDEILQYQAIGIAAKKKGKTEIEKTFSASRIYTIADVEKFYQSMVWLQSASVDDPKATLQEFKDCYSSLLQSISSTVTGLPLSPIDYFVQRIQEEGYRVGELTQRCLRLVYDDVKSGNNSGVTCLRRKNPDKKKEAADFNNGNTDVLIGNRVMASGISLHSSEAYADARPRTVITWEQQDSADIQTQFDGRADRTGQTSHCRFITLVSPIPGEQRYLMMNARKKRSLNANVEANQRTPDADSDMLNRYGARVIAEFAHDNPEFAQTVFGAETSAPNRRKAKPKVLTDGAAPGMVAKFLRDVGLLPCQEQQTVIDDITNRYRQLICSLDETGENDLYAKLLPLEALTLKSKIFWQGSSHADSPFAADAVLEEVEVNVLKKPLNAVQIIEQMSVLKDMKYLIPKIEEQRDKKEKEIGDYYSYLSAKALSQIATLRAGGKYTPSRLKELQERANNTKRRIDEIANLRLNAQDFITRLGVFKPGRPYSVPSILIADGQTDDPTFAKNIPVGIFMGYQVLGDKFTASRVLAVFAVSDSRSIIKIPMSNKAALATILSQSHFGISASRLATINLKNWDTNISQRNRETVFIITGNILAGIAHCRKLMKNVYKNKFTRLVTAMLNGHMVKYSDIDGNIKSGYMLSRSFNPHLLYQNLTI